MRPRTTADLVTSRALSLALHPAGGDPATVAASLARLAEGNEAPLRVALQRIQSRRPEHSAVADRAVAALRLALATAEGRQCA